MGARAKTPWRVELVLNRLGYSQTPQGHSRQRIYQPVNADPARIYMRVIAICRPTPGLFQLYLPVIILAHVPIRS